MAEKTTKREQAKEQDEAANKQWREDLDALEPKPAGVLIIKGKEYECMHFLDISVKDSIRVLDLARDIDSGESPYAEQLEKSKALLGILCPSMLELLEGDSLTPAQLVRAVTRAMITSRAQAATQDPRNGGGSPASSNTSESSPSDSDGPSGTSSKD